MYYISKTEIVKIINKEHAHYNKLLNYLGML